MTVPQTLSDRILAECTMRQQAYTELGKLCDSVGGRMSGTESGKRGEQWAFDLLNSFALDSVWREEFPVLAWERGELVATVTSPASWKLTALAHGYAPEHADVCAPVFSIGHGDLPDYEAAGDAVKGRILLCDEGVTAGRRGLHRSEKLRMAAEHGALGLMIYSSASGGLPRTGTCANGPAPIPGLGISQEDGLRLLRLSQGIKAVEDLPVVKIAMSNRFTPSTASNIIGELTGTNPNEYILAGAHLDSWDVAQGATDNGLGSAIVLEMARSLAVLGQRPSRSIRFAIWAAEEIGLCGSRNYVAQRSGGADLPSAVLNFDMTTDPYGYWAPKPNAFELAQAAGFAALREVALQLSGIGMKQEFVHKAGLHSDHQPFMLEGVQVIALLAQSSTQGGHYYHSVGDTFDKVSLPAFTRAAVVGAHTAWALADLATQPFPQYSTRQVRALIDEADLFAALKADDYDGPPMRIQA